MLKKFTALIIIAILSGSLVACNTEIPETVEFSSASSATLDNATKSEMKTESTTAAETEAATTSEQTTSAQQTTTSGSKKSAQQTESVITTANTTSTGMINATELFTNRDLTQNADLTDAKYYTVSDGQNINITSEGVYVISGSASNVTITVDAGDNDKVQIVLDGVSITNSSSPCIYVKNAEKVFVTTTSTDNALSVTGTFTADGTTNTDAVIFSRDDLVINGLGTLTINSTDNGISCKDDLKVTGGTITINCSSDGLEANDSIAIADGSITISTSKDGLHAENDDDNTTGYVYICGGTLNITAGDDGIHATTVAQIDGGTMNITAAEGIEGAFVQINSGTIGITSSDDGINGSNKSSAYSVTVEINGGDITINMGQGDTDAIDSNGNLHINGGTLNISASSPFDYDGQASYTGGTMIVNGSQTTTITNQMMGGGMGGMGGMHNDGGAGFPGR